MNCVNEQGFEWPHSISDSGELNPQITPAYVATKDDERRLIIAEQFDFKQDKSLSAVRFVCKNATHILKRRDEAEQKRYLATLASKRHLFRSSLLLGFIYQN